MANACQRPRPVRRAADQVRSRLQQRLTALIDAELTLKHVHWNVVGPTVHRRPPDARPAGGRRPRDGRRRGRAHRHPRWRAHGHARVRRGHPAPGTTTASARRDPRAPRRPRPRCTPADRRPPGGHRGSSTTSTSSARTCSSSRPSSSSSSSGSSGPTSRTTGDLSTPAPTGERGGGTPPSLVAAHEPAATKPSSQAGAHRLTVRIPPSAARRSGPPRRCAARAQSCERRTLRRRRRRRGSRRGRPRWPARSVRTTTTWVPPARRGRPQGRRRGRPVGGASSDREAVGGGQRRRGRRPCGVPKSCSKRSAGSAVAWGRNEKMPPPSLSTTTIVRSRPRPASPSRPLVSWRKATSPMSSAGRRRRRRGPRRPRSTPRRRCRWPPGWRAPAARARGAVPLDVAHRHRRRHHERGAVGQARPPRRGPRPARSARRGRPSTRVDGAPGRRPRRRAQRGQPRRGPPALRRPAGEAAAPRAGGAGGDARRRVRSGSSQAPSASTHDLAGAGGGQPLRPAPWRPAARRGAAPPRAGARRRTRRRAAGRRRRPPCGRPGTRQPDAGIGQHRPPEALGQACDAPPGRRRRRRPRSRPAPAARPAAVAASAPADAAGGPARRATAGRRAGRSGSGPGVADQRVAEGQVEVHRARPAAPIGLGHGPGGQRPPRAGGGLVGPRRARRTTGPPAVQVRLVDGLRRADVAAARAGGRRCTRAAAPGPGAASTTAGCSSTAAVPLVVQHHGGHARWPGRGRGPGSRRSARRGGRGAASRPSAARARASGVDREPGATTAWRRRPGPTRRPGWRERRLHGHRRMTASVRCSGPSGTGAGRRLVLVHGFTQTRPVAGRRSRPTWPPTTRWCAVDAPGPRPLGAT